MAGDIKQKFGTNGQTITITLASLTNNSARESTAIDNSTDLAMDVILSIKAKSGGSSTTSNGYLNVYAYGTADNGTTYPDNVTGSDAGITLVSPTELYYVGQVNVVANSTTYKKVFNLAQAFGGAIPQKWGIVIENKCGGTLDGTGGNFACLYQVVTAQYT